MRIFLTLALAGLSAAAFSQYKALPPDFEAKVDKISEAWRNPDGPGGIVAVAIDGKIEFVKGYGLANLEHHIPVKRETAFDIGSISKQFTAAIIQFLAEEGKLKLDDPIAKHLPELKNVPGNIQIQHLLHHTSGLRDYFFMQALRGMDPSFKWTAAQLVELVAKQRDWNFEPGSQYLYCNTGFFLLGQIAERVGGKPLAQLEKERIFDPLGMKHTALADPNTVVPNRAYSYAKVGSEYAYITSPLDINGDGGILTTVDDLLIWDQNFLHNKLGKSPEKFVQAMLTSVPLTTGKPNGYLCGIVKDEAYGQTRFGHDGGWLGFTSSLQRIGNVTLMVFTNAGRADATPVAAAIGEAIFGRGATTVETPAPVEIDAKKLDMFKGTYMSSIGSIIDFSQEDGQLKSRRIGLPTVAWAHIGQNRFVLPGRNVNLKFELDGDKVRRAILTQNNDEIELKPLNDEKPTKEQIKAMAGHFHSIELDTDFELRLVGDHLVGFGTDLENAPIRILNKEYIVVMGEIPVRLAWKGNQVKEVYVDSPRTRNLRYVRK